MKYTKKQFLEDVRKEVEAIKVNATKEEIQRMDLGTFDPTNGDNCVYGQLTGDCTSKRAIILIRQCCQRYISHENYSTDSFKIGFAHIKERINGTDGSVIEGRGNWNYKYLSSLEGYILLPDAKNANIIAYIKGEKSKLVL